MSQSLGKSGQIEGQSGKLVWTEYRLFMEGRRVGQSRKAGREPIIEAANHFSNKHTLIKSWAFCTSTWSQLALIAVYFVSERDKFKLVGVNSVAVSRLHRGRKPLHQVS